MGRNTLLLIGYSLATLGAATKIAGALLYTSKSLFVDALTCLANLVAGAFVVKLVVESQKPPNKDHTYGHERLLLAGVLVVIISYSFIAGLSLAELTETSEYVVGHEALYYAIAGSVFYAASITIMKKAPLAARVYAYFTSTELIESLIVVAAVWGGTYYSYLIDYAGALLLLGMIVVELGKETVRLIRALSDYAPPEVVENLRKDIESLGVQVRALRVREYMPGTYVGDVVIAVNGSDLRRAHKLADKVERIAKEKHNTIITVHYEPAECQ